MALQCYDHNEAGYLIAGIACEQHSGRRERYVRTGVRRPPSGRALPAPLRAVSTVKKVIMPTRCTPTLRAAFANSVAEGENSGRWRVPAGWTKINRDLEVRKMNERPLSVRGARTPSEVTAVSRVEP